MINLILGLESSCDETACSVVERKKDGTLWVRSSVISSQIEIHRQFGGVVPEVASRHHLKNIIPVMKQALQQAQVSLSHIQAIAVTQGPGLLGALLVALQAAKAIAFAQNIPFLGVHHLEGHLLAAFLHDNQTKVEQTDPSFPYLSLLVSGGHTSLILVKDFGEYQILGSTRDDAAGEAFDKIGKMLGLGYPAGPKIDQLSMNGNSVGFLGPKVMKKQQTNLDFSYSGLKTWVAQYFQKNGIPKDSISLANACSWVQEMIVEQLVRKSELALMKHQVSSFVLSGGVACNQLLRKELLALCQKKNIAFFVPPPRFCTDNAAMIAAAAVYRLNRGELASFTLNAEANLPFPVSASFQRNI